MSAEAIVQVLRQARGMRSVGSVAAACGLSADGLRAWESGRRQPSVIEATVWAWALRQDIALIDHAGMTVVGTELSGLLSADSARRAARELMRSARAERRRHRLAKIVVAEKLGITAERLARWERADPAPLLADLVRLAQVYELGVEVLSRRVALGFRDQGWHRQHPASPWSRIFPGTAEQIQPAMAFVHTLLEDYPRAEQIAFLAGELARHAITYTDSGRPDGVFVVRILAEPATDTVTITVTDLGNPSRPDDFTKLDTADSWGVSHENIGHAIWATFTRSIAG